mgnify:CR=1 FL=1
MATSQANPLAKQYLTNKELLKEIHLSKNNYSSYTKPEYCDYDLILPDTDKINIRTIAEAKRARALKLSQRALAEAQLINPKTKLAEVEIDYKKVLKTDVVFRIMTHDHIPLEPGRKKTPKNRGDHHSKCNFPPYQHFKCETINLLSSPKCFCYRSFSQFLLFTVFYTGMGIELDLCQTNRRICAEFYCLANCINLY